MSVVGQKVNAQVRSPVTVQVTPVYVPPSFHQFRSAATSQREREENQQRCLCVASYAALTSALVSCPCALSAVLTANHRYGHSVIAKARSKLGVVSRQTPDNRQQTAPQTVCKHAQLLTLLLLCIPSPLCSLGAQYQEYGVKSSAPLSASSALDGYVKADYTGPHFDLRSTYFTSKQTGDEFSFIPKGLPAGSTLALT
jgi:hypothetical protein